MTSAEGAAPVTRIRTALGSALTRLASRITGRHVYLSTSCLHAREAGRQDLHGYCQSNTGSNGQKVPAQCKFCAAPCQCSCHRQEAAAQ